MDQFVATHLPLEKLHIIVYVIRNLSNLDTLLNQFAKESEDKG